MSFYVPENNSVYFLEYQVLITAYKVRTLLLISLPRNSFFSNSKQYLIKVLQKKEINVITKLNGLFNNFMLISINNQSCIKIQYIFFILNRDRSCLLLLFLDNIKMDLQEVGGGCGDWMELAQDRDRWRALLSTVRNIRVPKIRGSS